MTQKEKQFRAELAALCKKHGVKIGSFDRYDNDEVYTGEDYYFQSPDMDQITLDEIAAEVNG